ncbi:MAG: sulfurtransferase TusE [Xanthomonadales bacterium]|nr:sulfurtransferase TusE [Xanthomonadales bacterium]|tara:strand:+ start:921 stop:1265 length:345 start_codon:yes stop_codon:yes gene_type:complete
MAQRRTLAIAGREIGLDADGHLIDPDDWSESVADEMARLDGLELCRLRWWLIRFVRAHHAEYGMPPLMRVAIKAMRREAGIEDASSRTLYRLFPDGPIREACRYGGLPRPESCI